MSPDFERHRRWLEKLAQARRELASAKRLAEEANLELDLSEVFAALDKAVSKALRLD